MGIGGTDLYIHKYAGVTNQGPSSDATQPQYLEPNPTQIQDLLFLENRDRSYEPNIYRLRGHYNVQNNDMDLSQFGLFLSGDMIQIVVAYNQMIDIVGRKLMVGDVLELPHLIDYNPLNETIPVALKRFMQITDANFASEGFSPTWFPHLWRIKCEPLINSEEFADILNTPINQDNYLGDFNPTTAYPPGYTVNYAGVTYQSIADVPIGTTPPNATYWSVSTGNSLADIMSTYNTNIAINNANLVEAAAQVPKSGYDNSNLYVAPTYGLYNADGTLSTEYDQPAPPINIVINEANTSGQPILGTVMMIKDPNYKSEAFGIKISKQALQSIWNMTADGGSIKSFVPTQLQVIEQPPIKSSTGSGSVENRKMLSVEALTSGGPAIGPYGTADNTYATADADPTAPGFTGNVTINMDFRADCIPGYQYIARATPRSFGYTSGYLTGDGNAPNGFPTGSGISFPQSPNLGDYFLRIDYLPQILYRWDGNCWIRISENVRTQLGFADANNQSLLNSFINDPNQIYSNNEGQLIPESQQLNTILRIAPDPLPPSTTKY